MEISIVIPLYNEENLVKKLYDEVSSSIQSITSDYEIICVDDGSSDNTLNELLKQFKLDEHFKVIQLSRNFGHQAAYTAGLEYASGNNIVMLDGDLQDPPKLLPEMYKELISGNYDIVYGKRTGRKENYAKRLSIKLFHILFNKLSNINVPSNVGNFSIMNRKALNSLLSLQEKNRYLPGLRYFIGFKQGLVEYERPDRSIGDAKMSIQRLLSLAFDAFFSFSKLPIKICLMIGIIGILFSFLGTSIVVYKKVIGVAITGWTSMMLSLFFFGSVQLFFLGVLGEYIYRIYGETQNRPIYIIKNTYDKSI